MLSILETGKTYIMYGCTGDTDLHCVLHYRDNGEGKYVDKVTVTDSVTSVSSYAYVVPGGTVSNAAIDYMLVESSVKPTEYIPFGYRLSKIAECTLCPPNTYKDFVGREKCTPCPDGLISASGTTSVNDCGHVLHVDNYVAFMPIGRRTEHGLCTMFDGKKYCADMYEKQ